MIRVRVLQLKRIRDIRADSKKKVWTAARAKLFDAQQHLDTLIQRKSALEQEALTRINMFREQEGLLSAGQINSLKMLIETLKSEAESMVDEILQAEYDRDLADEEMQVTFTEMRKAQRSVDQLQTLDERLLVEESKETERLEEAENERIVFKKRPLAPPEPTN